MAAGIIMIPVLCPIAKHFGFDEVHFAMLVMMTMAVGAITPPVGVTLYLVLGIAKTSLSEVNRYIWPLIGVIVAVLVVTALVPSLITFVPKLVLG